MRLFQAPRQDILAIETASDSSFPKTHLKKVQCIDL